MEAGPSLVPPSPSSSSLTSISVLEDASIEGGSSALPLLPPQAAAKVRSPPSSSAGQEGETQPIVSEAAAAALASGVRTDGAVQPELGTSVGDLNVKEGEKDSISKPPELPLGLRIPQAVTSAATSPSGNDSAALAVVDGPCATSSSSASVDAESSKLVEAHVAPASSAAPGPSAQVEPVVAQSVEPPVLATSEPAVLSVAESALPTSTSSAVATVVVEPPLPASAEAPPAPQLPVVSRPPAANDGGGGVAEAIRVPSVSSTENATMTGTDAASLMELIDESVKTSAQIDAPAVSGPASNEQTTAIAPLESAVGVPSKLVASAADGFKPSASVEVKDFALPGTSTAPHVKDAGPEAKISSEATVSAPATSSVDTTIAAATEASSVDLPLVAAQSGTPNGSAAEATAGPAAAVGIPTPAAIGTPTGNGSADKGDPPAANGAAPVVAASPEVAAHRISLVLKINKELIRLCMEMQTKSLTAEPVYREAGLRIQANLAWLAGMAERASKGQNGPAAPPPPRALPFPATPYAPDSMVPLLYAHLVASVEGKTVAASTKRARSSDGANDEESRKRAVKINGDAAVASAPSPASVMATPSPAASSGAVSAAPPVPSVVQAAQQIQPSQTRPATPQTFTVPFQGAAVASSMPPPSLPGSQPATPVASGPGAQAVAALGGPSPQQTQALINAFGPNAVQNLNSLQAHLKGQPQPFITYMEGQIPNFRMMGVQQQLRAMTNAQNVAVQRQRQAQLAAQQNQQQQQQQVQAVQQQHMRRTSAAQSPPAAMDSPHAMSMGQSAFQPGINGSIPSPSNRMPAPSSSGTASPMMSQHGHNGVPGAQFSMPGPAQGLQAQAPGTPSMQSGYARPGSAGPGGPMGSPSPAPNNFMAGMQTMGMPAQQQQHQQFAQPQPQHFNALAQGFNPSNLPPHLQQQLLAQFQQQQQQHQAQQQNNLLGGGMNGMPQQDWSQNGGAMFNAQGMGMQQAMQQQAMQQQAMQQQQQQQQQSQQQQQPGQPQQQFVANPWLDLGQ